jgi:hypothetical protein
MLTVALPPGVLSILLGHIQIQNISTENGSAGKLNHRKVSNGNEQKPPANTQVDNF